MLLRVKCPVVELEVFGRESLLGDVATGQWIQGVSRVIGLFYKFYTIYSLVILFLGLLIADLASIFANNTITTTTITSSDMTSPPPPGKTPFSRLPNLF